MITVAWRRQLEKLLDRPEVRTGLLPRASLPGTTLRRPR